MATRTKKSKRARPERAVASRLASYRKKRDFDLTPEPAGQRGERSSSRGGPRFVVHEHHARSLHWDLRLEREGVLLSWAIPKGLPEDPAENHLAVHVEDHPLSYLDFSGTIPEGTYGAGLVIVWDSGEYEVHSFDPRKVVFTLHGKRARGRFALFQTRGKSWLIHRMSPREPGREPLPRDLRPMLARLSRDLPGNDGEWAFEVKWDGIRALATIEGGRARFVTRNGRDVTRAYPELRKLGEALGARTAVLDGEIVALLEDGRSSFERLQSRMNLENDSAIRRKAREVPVHFVIFDVLFLEGRSLVDLPYVERRKVLATLALEGPSFRTPAYQRGKGRSMLENARARGLEGLIAKRLDGVYEPGERSGSWLKVKALRGQELVIGGFVPGKGAREGRVGALLVGHHDVDGKTAAKRGVPQRLVYAGKVGTGYSLVTLEKLAALLEPLRCDRSPFDEGSPPRGAVFVEPRLVGEFAFSEWTSRGSLRQPVFKGLREDEDPRDVVREEVA